MKTWHLKKGVERFVEAITGISMFGLLGVCGVENAKGFIIIGVLVFNTLAGLLILDRYGN